MGAPDLYLDPQIRNWVLFPITLVMVLVGILRHNVTQLLDGPPKRQSKAAVREQRALQRSRLLIASSPSCPLPPLTFQALASHLSLAFQQGAYLKVKPTFDKSGQMIEPEKTAPPNPLSDPNAMEGMMDGMKKQVVMMVPNFAIMAWINFFFSGFVCIKLPFPLTLGFKSMLQRDIVTPDMDVRWVSALSWYFLNWFGLNGVFRLLLSDPSAARPDPTSSAFMASLGGALPPGAPPPQGDFPKFFRQEEEGLQMAVEGYRYAGEGIERSVASRWAL